MRSYLTLAGMPSVAAASTTEEEKVYAQLLAQSDGQLKNLIEVRNDSRRFDYSMRSAAIGLMRVARRAGSQVAKSAAMARVRGAKVNATGSSAPTS
jgi:hypothetical protein